jgi:hypothetical protein
MGSAVLEDDRALRVERGGGRVHSAQDGGQQGWAELAEKRSVHGWMCVFEVQVSSGESLAGRI